MTVRAKHIWKRCVSGAAYALWLAFVFTNSLRSGAASAKQSAFAESFLRRLLRYIGYSGNVGRTAEIVVRKSAHIFEFFVLFILLALFLGLPAGKRRKAVLISAALSLTSAAADELLQLYSGRGASVTDVLIDAVGVALGALVYLLFSRLREKQRNRRLGAD